MADMIAIVTDINTKIAIKKIVLKSMFLSLREELLVKGRPSVPAGTTALFWLVPVLLSSLMLISNLAVHTCNPTSPYK